MRRLLIVGLLFVLASVANAERPIFVFQNGLRFPSLEAETTFLRKHGYAGVGSANLANLQQRLDAYRAADLRVFSIYVGANLGPDGPSYDKGIPAAIEALRGSKAIVELTIRSKIGKADDQAVKIVREVAELAAKADLRVALYPHHGFYVATTTDALRITQQVARPNVGIMFNLCHFLKGEDADKLAPTLAELAPHLFQVSTCGADRDGKSWQQLIRPLDAGTFDQKELFSTLDKLEFAGPVGLQCYGIKGDSASHLQRSATAWRQLNSPKP